jgi:hypothetical protein
MAPPTASAEHARKRQYQLVLPAQCQHQRRFQLQLPSTLSLTTVTASSSRDTILSLECGNARKEKRPRRLQDPQNNADRSLPVPQHCSRCRRADSETLLRHRQLSRARAVLWTSQGWRPLRARQPRSPVFSSAGVPRWARRRHLDARLVHVAKLFCVHASFRPTDREQACVRRRCRG